MASTAKPSIFYSMSRVESPKILQTREQLKFSEIAGVGQITGRSDLTSKYDRTASPVFNPKHTSVTVTEEKPI